MSSLRCTDLRSLAPDLALDELTGADRAAALEHLATCADCRSFVAELAVVADSLLLLAPESEPPPGFETAVLSRTTGGSPRRAMHRRWRAAAIAVGAAAAGVVLGIVVADGVSDPTAPRLPIAAVLTGADGDPAGTVVLAADPDRMTCVFESERFGGAYAVEVDVDGGGTVDLGEFHADGAPWSWTIELPDGIAAEDVLAVRVRSGDGVVRVAAELD